MKIVSHLRLAALFTLLCIQYARYGGKNAILNYIDIVFCMINGEEFHSF